MHTLQRATESTDEFAGDLAARPDQYPPFHESKLAFEMQVRGRSYKRHLACLAPWWLSCVLRRATCQHGDASRALQLSAAHSTLAVTVRTTQQVQDTNQCVHSFAFIWWPQAVRLLVACLLDIATALPIEVDTLHNRVSEALGTLLKGVRRTV